MSEAPGTPVELQDDDADARESEAAAPDGHAVRAGHFYVAGGRHDADGEEFRYLFAVEALYAATPSGQFARGEFLGTDDEYWQWYVEVPGERGRISERFLFHLCAAPGCTETAHRPEIDVVHVAGCPAGTHECPLDEAIELLVS